MAERQIAHSVITAFTGQGPYSVLLALDQSQQRRLKPTTIRAWILKRKIQYAKIGGRVFIRVCDVDALIEASLVPAKAGESDPFTG